MWEELPDRFEVSGLRTSRNAYDIGGVDVAKASARSLWTFLPRGRLGDLAMGLTGDRYVGADEAFAAADIVHSEELGYWHSGDAARRKAQNRFKLAITVWETLPLLSAFRNPRARTYRLLVLGRADLFLPTTERARTSLLLEGAPPERVEVCYPGVDLERFSRTSAPRSRRPSEHVIVSPGRLVWEKGHQDVEDAGRGGAPCRRGSGAAGSSSPTSGGRQRTGGEAASRLRARARIGRRRRVHVPSVRGDARDVRGGFVHGAGLPLERKLREVARRNLPHCFWKSSSG